LLGVTAALIFRCGAPALRDLSIDDRRYLGLGQTASLRFRGAEASRSSGEMPAGGRVLLV
jgi:hypothetical protein